MSRTSIPLRRAARTAAALLLAAAASRATAEEFILNGNFDAGTSDPWWATSNVALQVVGGQLCATVPAGTVNPWDAIIGQNGVQLEQGKGYQFSFQASADAAVSVRAIVQQPDAPYTATLAEPVQIGVAPAAYSFSFTDVLATGGLGVQFQMGGNASGFTVCFDDVSLSDGGAGYVPDTGPAVRVNQLGYVPFGPKRADLVTSSTAPQTWELLAADGSVVASGSTVPYGADAASGDTVQLIDFSRVRRPGDGYTLRVGDQVSYPFAISSRLYDELRYDAVEFFYHARSGIPIDGQLVGEPWARPAGHLGIAPNQGDTSVPCLPGTCAYSLDVRGGWYDAGDHGKYVVNGGIAAWQLMNTWERAQRDRRALRDGTQRIPEQANGVPDILDEARWELEFLLRMQVPDGQPYAGMAHHKIHDDAWTPIPMRPDQDPQPRHLQPPSTAATLNLAATAAQCARIWRAFDGRFARRCLVAAERAYAAAVANPAVFCPPAPSGGGDYADADVSDELYWAAAELFVTTGKPAYREALRASPHAQGKGIPGDGFSWGSVSALGDITLAVVPNRLPPRELFQLRRAIAAAADERIATMQAQGYPVPYAPADGKYVWGSNSQVLNQMALLAVAYDVTLQPRYRLAAFEAMDYVLGRNGLNLSYVTGYGTKYSQNQHHRFFAHMANAAYPHPPAGSIAGGPNSLLQDPVAASKLQGCAAHRCYIDSIESYSTNEVAINWNSALAWMTAWLADHAE